MGTNRKKAIFSLCILVLLLIVISPAFAAETASTNRASEATGILPSNPFYFFKEWGRSIRRTLSFTDLKKAETQLNVVVEQIAEIEKLNELRVEKREAFERAVANYETNIDLLKTYLLPVAQQKGNLLHVRASKQYAVLQGLLGKFEGKEQTREFDELVLRAIRQLVEATAVGLQGGVDIQTGVDAGDNAERELRGALFVERLMRVVPIEVVYELAKLQQTLIQKWIGRPRLLEMLGGVRDQEPLLQVIDIAREKVFDNEVRNVLNMMRQATLDELKEKGVTGRAFVTQAVKDGKSFIDDVGKRVAAGGELAAQVRTLIERAKFQRAAAEAFLEDGSLGNAYGQLVGAVTAARNAAVLLSTTPAEYATELQYMRQYFDAAMERVRAARLEPKTALHLFTKIGEAEVAIAKLGDLIAQNSSVVKIVTATRVVESMLGTLDQLIKERAK